MKLGTCIAILLSIAGGASAGGVRGTNQEYRVLYASVRGLQYPFFRFVPWCTLDDKAREDAQVLGWDAEKWEVPEKANETKSFMKVLERSGRRNDNSAQILFSMGWSETTYDCYVNHYRDYTWEHLKEFTDTIDYWRTLGWNVTSWRGDIDEPATMDKKWDELTPEEQYAATQLCYFKELWDEVPISEWDAFGNGKVCQDLEVTETIIPSTSGVATSTSAPAEPDKDNTPEKEEQEETTVEETEGEEETAGKEEDEEWYESVNDEKGEPDTEAQPESQVELEGTTEAPTTVDTADDETVVATGMATAAATEVATTPPVDSTVATNEDNAGVTVTKAPVAEPEKETTADREPVIPANYASNVDNRFLMWDWLFPVSQDAATILGYTEETWNKPGTADIEELTFAELNADQVEATYVLGFAPAEMWNCAINHYRGFTWQQLAQLDGGVQEAYRILGWTQNSWKTPNQNAPESDNTTYEFLTPEQQMAISRLCYRPETWDERPLSEWV